MTERPSIEPPEPSPASASPAAGRTERLALVALFAGAIGIGFSPIFVRLADVDPTASAFYRTALAVPLLFSWPMIMPRRASVRLDRPTSWRELALLSLAGFFFACDLGFYHWSIRFTSIANATLFPNLAPIFVTFGAWYLFGERITNRFLLGLVIAVAGAVMVLGDSASGGEGHIFGDALALTAALFYAGYLLSVARLRRHYTTLTLMAWSTLATTIFLLPVALIGEQHLLPQSLTGWAVLFALAWLSHAGGQGLIAFALAHLPVSFSSVGLLLQPAFAALSAYLLLGEDIDSLQLFGGAVILTGVYLARRGSRR